MARIRACACGEKRKTAYAWRGRSMSPTKRACPVRNRRSSLRGAGGEHLAPGLVRSARAALRETWEEVGVLVGRRAAADDPATPAAPGLTAIEAAYAERGITAAFDVLTYVGRAITPTPVFRRFNTRFFLGDGSAVFGDPVSTDELEDVGWHPVGRRPLAPFRDVTQFMLTQAIALREGKAA